MRAWNRQELSELDEELESLELEEELGPDSLPPDTLSLIAECSMLRNPGSTQQSARTPASKFPDQKLLHHAATRWLHRREPEQQVPSKGKAIQRAVL